MIVIAMFVLELSGETKISKFTLIVYVMHFPLFHSFAHDVSMPMDDRYKERKRE
jgi:hypothetical protein